MGFKTMCHSRNNLGTMCHARKNHGMTETLKREMTITHRDFFRILPKALKLYPYQQHEKVISIPLDEGEIVIILAEEQRRQIASLSLPVTYVTFQIKNVAKKSKKGFFKQFDQAYQRGGG